MKGCQVVFKSQGEDHELWKMAEWLGATRSTEVDSSVTHVVSSGGGTEKSRWAMQEKKFLVHSDWIKAAYYPWRKQPEENYAVTVHLDRRKKEEKKIHGGKKGSSLPFSVLARDSRKTVEEMRGFLSLQN